MVCDPLAGHASIASGTGRGMVTINAEATVGGMGRIGGNATVHGTLSPGAQPGAQQKSCLGPALLPY